MNDFFAMGGYAVFVWPAYVASLFGLTLMVILAKRRLARARNKLGALSAGQQTANPRDREATAN